MSRTYELGLVLDPFLSDEEQGALVDEYKQMVSAAGCEVLKEESWGKRKLAYPIRKKSEGRYVFLYLEAKAAGPSFAELETRMNQNEAVMRYLVVRTDQMLQRALRRGKKRHIAAAEAVGLVPPKTHETAEA